MSQITFKSKLNTSDTKTGEPLTLIALPMDASKKLPSRGMVMVKGVINDFEFLAPLEPDGKGSHLLLVDQEMLKKAKVKDGDSVTLSIEAVKDWPEPKVPTDLKKALGVSKRSEDTWKDITPMARWDWIRWINAAKQEETRKKRIESIASRFGAGKRRPCCFNRTECTLPLV